MSDSSGIPPGSKPSSPPSPAEQMMSAPIQTGMGKTYDLKGDTAIKKWVQMQFPSMSPDQIKKFIQQFTMTLCNQINQQIKKELSRARKTARKLKRAEEGE